MLSVEVRVLATAKESSDAASTGGTAALTDDAESVRLKQVMAAQAPSSGIVLASSAVQV